MRRLSSESGLTLVEVLIAATLLILLLTPILGLFTTSRLTVESSARMSDALALARAAMDEMVARESWTAIATEDPSTYPSGPEYSITVTVTERTAWLKDVTVRVSWFDGHRSQAVVLSSAVYRREVAT